VLGWKYVEVRMSIASESSLGVVRESVRNLASTFRRM
jgi:hypothetical protein